MSEKPPAPKPIPAMRDLPPDQQDDYIARYQMRVDVTKAMKQLARVLKEWVHDTVMDDKRFENFNAHGHHGEYTEFPSNTLARKLADLGWTEAQILLFADRQREGALDYMSAEELAHVIDRITYMLRWFAQRPEGGPYQSAYEMYQAIGHVVRGAVKRQTDHDPEQFPTPDDKITGRESPKRFKPALYRAPLFPPEEDEQ